MSTLAPLAIVLLAWADPPADPTPAPAPAPAGTAAIAPLDVISALESALSTAIASAEPSVVAIHREKSENEETLAIRGREPNRNQIGERRFPQGRIIAGNDFFGEDTQSFDFGSGVVIGPKGEILTAFHVVRGAKTLIVRAANKQSFEAEIIAADPRSDLAVIAPRELPNVPAPQLKRITIGDSARLRKGSFLVALGNPFNAAKDGRASATWGILSNVARRIEPAADEIRVNELQLKNYPTLLQLDAKLNLGMSGGAVVNLKGELIGITTAAANAAGFDSQAGYAIPMDAVGRRVIEALIQGKEFEYGFLGIRLDTDTGSNRVKSADPGTPAAQGGVLLDDAIIAVGDMPVTDSDSLFLAISSIPAGEQVKLKILRKNQPVERAVRLAKRKPMASVIATNRPTPWRGLRVDFTSTIGGTTVGPDVLDAMSREGVLVTEVVSGSEADRSGIRTGQIINRVNDTPVRAPREFVEAVSGAKGPVRLDTDSGSVTVK